MSDVITMYDAVDIFPREFSETVHQLSYAEKNFKFWANDPDIKTFILFVNDLDIVYYSKRPLNEQAMLNVTQIGKECRKFGKFYPKKINWNKIGQKLKQPPVDEMRKNADHRLGFKLRNTFLVKAYFTFGLRTVEKGTAHVIQTLKVPLIIYVCPQRLKGKAEKSFPYTDLHMFDMSILLPNGIYRIPPGVRYVLFTTQKNYFSLDLVPEDMELTNCVDPIRHKVTKIPGLYDRPPKTPYIEETPQSKNNDEDDEGDFYEFFESNPFKAPLPAPPETTISKPIEPSSQQITYLLIPQNPPPILERKIVLASPEFVKNYHFLLSKKIEEDPIVKFVPSAGPDPEPLDLSISNNMGFENGPIMEIDISSEDLNEANSSITQNPNDNINSFNLETSNQNSETLENSYPNPENTLETFNYSIENSINSDDLMDLDDLINIPFDKEENEEYANLFKEILASSIE